MQQNFIIFTYINSTLCSCLWVFYIFYIYMSTILNLSFTKQKTMLLFFLRSSFSTIGWNWVKSTGVNITFWDHFHHRFRHISRYLSIKYFWTLCSNILLLAVCFAGILFSILIQTNWLTKVTKQPPYKYDTGGGGLASVGWYCAVYFTI